MIFEMEVWKHSVDSFELVIRERLKAENCQQNRAMPAMDPWLVTPVGSIKAVK
jgi:hypothetical protein